MAFNLVSMHELKKETVDYCQRLVCGGEAGVAVGGGKSITIFGREGTITSQSEFDEEVTGLSLGGSRLLVQLGRRAAIADVSNVRPSGLRFIEPEIYAGADERYCLDGDLAWVVVSGPRPALVALRASNLEEVSRLRLDRKWFGGPITLFPGGGSVAIGVPMDSLLGVATLEAGGRISLSEIRSREMYCLGIVEGGLVCVGKTIVIRDEVTGEIVKEFDRNGPPPIDATAIGGKLLLFGKNGVQTTGVGALSRVDLAGLPVAPLFRGVECGDDLATVSGDRFLRFWSDPERTGRNAKRLPTYLH